MTTDLAVENPRIQEAIAFPQLNQFNVNCEGFEWFELAGFAIVKFAFWLKEREEELGSKSKRYRALLQGEGMLPSEGNKYVKLGRHAQHFQPEELSKLGTMMLSLVAPKFASLWKAMPDKGKLTQTEVYSLKKELYPSKKASKSDALSSIWRQPPGGGNRYCQIPPIDDQETGVRIQRVIDKEGITAQEATKKAFICYEENQAKQLALASETEQITSSISSNEQINIQAELNVHTEDKTIPTTSTALVVSSADAEKNLATKALDAALEASPGIFSTSTSELNQSGATPFPSSAHYVTHDEQANAHVELNIEEQAIATTAAPDITASSNTPLQQTDEILSSINTVSQSQLETPAGEQASVQAELNNHIEDRGEAIAPEITTLRQVTTILSDRDSATTVVEEPIPQGTSIEEESHSHDEVVTTHEGLHTCSEEQLPAIPPLESPTSHVQETAVHSKSDCQPATPIIQEILPLTPHREETHSPSDELEKAQLELYNYLEEQVVTTLADASIVTPLDERVELLLTDEPNPRAEERILALTSQQENTPSVESKIEDEIPLHPSILPTKRYQKGWRVGDLAIANTTYESMPMSFRIWCEGQPVKIAEVSGDVGEVQILRVTRHDGASQSIPSTWVEEVTKSPLTLGVSLETKTTQVQPILYPPATPTQRYKQGWKVRDLAIANTTSEYFMHWCEGKAVTIQQVSGEVGSIQTLSVTRHDGQTCMSFGNWIEEVPGSDDGNTLSPLPSSPSDPPGMYKVVGTGDHWEGEVVKIDEHGDGHHRISAIDGGNEWTPINPQYLVSVSNEEAANLRVKTTLAERVQREFGLSQNDKVEYKIADYTFSGTIARLTQLGAYIDEGIKGQNWVEYEKLNKVHEDNSKVTVIDQEQTTQESIVQTNHFSLLNSGNEPSESEAKLEEVIDYSKLSDQLKKATCWKEVEELVECDRPRFAKAVKGWTGDEKQVLVKHLTTYLEANPKALLSRELDWVSLPSLEKAFKNLSFKVKDIQNGLTAPWVNGCRFASVANFGNDAHEIWIFISPTQQEIEVVDRKDFEVVRF